MLNYSPSPPPFLATPGPACVPRRQWKLAFLNYLEAVGGDDFAPKRRKAILLNALGLEGQRIYNSVAPATPASVIKEKGKEGVTEGHDEKNVFDEALAVLDNHFSTATNELMERHRFRQRRQMPGEAFEAYAAALRELSSDCNFGEAADKTIRDQLLEGTASQQIRERLLFEGTSLTLNRAIDPGRHIEQTQRELKEFAGVCRQRHSKRRLGVDFVFFSQHPICVCCVVDVTSFSLVSWESKKRNIAPLAKGFIHQVKVRASVKPVAAKLRRLPITLREQVSEELQRLERLDIIERVDAAEWTSPIVVVRKKDGTIRLCVDLREPNKVIIVDGFPLPHTEELLHQMVWSPLHQHGPLSRKLLFCGGGVQLQQPDVPHLKRAKSCYVFPNSHLVQRPYEVFSTVRPPPGISMQHKAAFHGFSCRQGRQYHCVVIWNIAAYGITTARSRRHRAHSGAFHSTCACHRVRN
ncbi:uncharacterized protein ISCGN_011123 [Ixodes scapularis]